MQNVQICLVLELFPRFVGIHDMTLNAETKQRTR
jgi:hypothetical protein